MAQTSTRLLVLGAVRESGPVHGYNLRRQLLSIGANEWANVTPGSIYNALKTLVRESLLEVVGTDRQGARPERTMYRLTGEGEKAFQRLLVAPESASARDHAAARAVQEVADEPGITASQAAIAWTRARSRTVHPIIGARSAEQLQENLGAIDVVLPEEAIQHLAAAVEFDVGFPTGFIAETSPVVFGEATTRLDGRS